jgi:methionyl-tRNA synthetase
VTKFVSSKFHGVIPDSGEAPGAFTNDVNDDPDPTFLDEVNALLSEYINTMEAVKIRAGLHIVLQVSGRGNLYLQQTEFFKLFESNPKLCAKVISRAINLIYALTALVHPFMPSTSTAMLEQLNAPPRTVPLRLGNDLLAGHAIGKPDYLFKKIDESNADTWRVQFGGKQASTVAVEAVDNPQSKRAAAKAKKAATEELVISPSAAKSDEVLEMENVVKSQGDKVRRIKTGKPEDGDGTLEEALVLLQKLKLGLQELSTAS